jgi:hypothetical protein
VIAACLPQSDALAEISKTLAPLYFLGAYIAARVFRCAELAFTVFTDWLLYTAVLWRVACLVKPVG